MSRSETRISLLRRRGYPTARAISVLHAPQSTPLVKISISLCPEGTGTLQTARHPKPKRRSKKAAGRPEVKRRMQNSEVDSWRQFLYKGCADGLMTS
jgi:hypothetical protein